MRRGVSIRRLCDELDVSRATLYRDLDVLSAAGLPIVSERVNGEARRRLLTDVAPTRGLGSKELAAIALARHSLTGLEGSGLVGTLDSILRTKPAPRVKIGARVRASKRSPSVVHALDRAIQERRRVRMRYRGTTDSAPRTREMDPAGLHLEDGHAYVYAFALDRDEWRTFKIARIHWIEILDVPSEHHPGLERITSLTHAVRVWSGDPVDVTIRIAAGVAWLLPEWPLVPDQRIEERSDGSMLVHAKVAGLVEVRRWVLSWGRNATVLAPKALRDAVCDELNDALAGYVKATDRVVSPIVRRTSGTTSAGAPSRRKRTASSEGT